MQLFKPGDLVTLINHGGGLTPTYWGISHRCLDCKDAMLKAGLPLDLIKAVEGSRTVSSRDLLKNPTAKVILLSPLGKSHWKNDEEAILIQIITSGLFCLIHRDCLKLIDHDPDGNY